MNCCGIIRRVDELGRVVIPVEIRRILGIKEGENLEFIVSDKNIVLTKKSMIDGNTSFFNTISEKLSEVVEGSYFLTDRERIFSSNNKDLIEKKLDGAILNLLSLHEDVEINNRELDFDGVKIKSTFYVFPYMVESDIAGFIVLYNISGIEKYNKLIKFIISYIHDKLSL